MTSSQGDKKEVEVETTGLPAHPPPSRTSNRTSYLPSYYGDTLVDDDSLSETYLSPRAAPTPFDSIEVAEETDTLPRWVWPATMAFFMTIMVILVVLIFVFRMQDKAKNDEPHTSTVVSASQTLASVFDNIHHGPKVAPTSKSAPVSHSSAPTAGSSLVSTETLYTTFGTTTVSVKANVTGV